VQPLEKLTDKHSRAWGTVTHLKVRGGHRGLDQALLCVCVSSVEMCPKQQQCSHSPQGAGVA
jgi:hypothetical protein